MKVIIISYELGSLDIENKTKSKTKITNILDKETDEYVKSRHKNQLTAWIKANNKCQKVLVT